MAQKWARLDRNPNGGGYVYRMSFPKNLKTYILDANGAKWDNLPNDLNITLNGKKLNNLMTNTVASGSEANGNDITIIKNVIEGYGDKVNDYIINNNVPRKSVIGNNGNFDLQNINIYKLLTPFGLVTHNNNNNDKNR